MLGSLLQRPRQDHQPRPNIWARELNSPVVEWLNKGLTAVWGPNLERVVRDGVADVCFALRAAHCRRLARGEQPRQKVGLRVLGDYALRSGEHAEHLQTIIRGESNSSAAKRLMKGLTDSSCCRRF
eukprot:1194129-Prorocentrum_minimum.AAC.1